MTRLSVLDSTGICLIDSVIKPLSTVLDLNTIFSGITTQCMANATETLESITAKFKTLANSDTILVGHGLENDLKALRLIHMRVIDTAQVFPHERGFPNRNSLKFLARTILDMDIQNSEGGHDSTQDAETCLLLLIHKIKSVQ